MVLLSQILLVGSLALGAATPDDRDAFTRRFIFNSDGGNIFLDKAPPMQPEDVHPYVDEVADQGVTTFFICPNYGMPMMYPSQVTEMIGQINQWSTGWTNYFGYGYPRVAFRAMHSFIVNRLTNHLQRRSQRAYRAPAGKSFYAHVHDLGLKRL